MTQPLKRRHRAGYGVDYQPKLIALGPVTIWVEEDNVTQKIGVVTERLEENSEVMKVVADRMVAIVQENIQTGEFLPLLPETVQRRTFAFRPTKGATAGPRGPVSSAQPLVASGALVYGIVPRSKAGYAAAQRGRDQWYGFLHDGGVGRVDRRPFMRLVGGQVEEVVRIYDEWLETVVEDD